MICPLCGCQVGIYETTNGYRTIRCLHPDCRHETKEKAAPKDDPTEEIRIVFTSPKVKHA
jgi:ssDNA-binding Zn-finger/Zn-ribbon topoisomerase 1